MKAFVNILKPILIRLLVMAISFSLGCILAEWYHKENYKEMIKYELERARIKVGNDRLKDKNNLK